MTARLLKSERLRKVRQGKRPVNDRLYSRGLKGTDKRDLVLPAANN